MVLFNFRGDRAIEMSQRLRGARSSTSSIASARPDVLFAGMMQYDGDLHVPKRFLVPPPADRAHARRVLGAQPACTQFASSETQKFGHVTYFWNGNRSGMFDDALREVRRGPERPRVVRGAARG